MRGGKLGGPGGLHIEHAMQSLGEALISLATEVRKYRTSVSHVFWRQACDSVCPVLIQRAGSRGVMEVVRVKYSAPKV